MAGVTFVLLATGYLAASGTMYLGCPVWFATCVGLLAVLLHSVSLLRLHARATWLPINTAPRDGTLIWIARLNKLGLPAGKERMHWAVGIRPGIVAAPRGFWSAPGGYRRWTPEDDGGKDYGPTIWRPDA